MIAAFALAIALLPFGGGGAAQAIIGGQKAALTEAPFTVGIRSDQTIDGVLTHNLCGGVQLSEFWVLTSKHCVIKNTNVTVFVGSAQPWGGTAIGVTHVVATPDADLALLKLAKSGYWGNPGQYAKISILPQLAQAQIFGWGVEGIAEDSPLPPTLKSAYVNVTSLDETNVTSSDVTLEYGHLIKTVKVTGQQSFGDSGGPLVQRGAVIGIVTTIDAESFSGEHPIGYTMLLSHYIGWIDSTLGFDTRAEQVQGVVPGVQLQSASGRILKTGNVGNDFAYGLVENLNGSPYGWRVRMDYAGGIQLEGKNGMCLGIDAEVPGVFSKLGGCDLTNPKQKFQLVDTGGVDGNGVEQYYLQSVVSGLCVQERPLALAITLVTGACSNQTRWRGVTAGAESSQAYIDETFAKLAATRAQSEEVSKSRPPRETPPVVTGPADITVSTGQAIKWTASIDRLGWRVRYFLQFPGENGWGSAYGAPLPAPVTFGYSGSSVTLALDGLRVKAVFTGQGESVETAPATIHVIPPR